MTEHIFREVHYGYTDGTVLGRKFEKQEEIVRCRDCRYATISTMGVCKYCEMFVLPDTDGYGADPQVNLPLDFFCAWGERRERESAEVWNQWSADDVTCSEES